MLPVLEDVGLGKRSEAGYFNLDSLLLYSAVCGTGLDTIPIPGDVSISQIAAILTDVAALSTQLTKPLSVRLFPRSRMLCRRHDPVPIPLSDKHNCYVCLTYLKG